MTLAEYLVDYPTDAPSFRIVDERFAAEVVDSDRLLAGERMIVGGDQGKWLRAQRGDVDILRVRVRERDERDIKPTALHRAKQLAGTTRFDAHLHLDEGPPPPKRDE